MVIEMIPLINLEKCILEWILQLQEDTPVYAASDGKIH